MVGGGSEGIILPFTRLRTRVAGAFDVSFFANFVDPDSDEVRDKVRDKV